MPAADDQDSLEQYQRLDNNVEPYNLMHQIIQHQS